MIIYAGPTNADEITVDVTFRAKLKEWKQLRAVIMRVRDTTDARMIADTEGHLNEPFWSIVHRLDDVIATAERQHSNYAER